MEIHPYYWIIPTVVIFFVLVIVALVIAAIAYQRSDVETTSTKEEEEEEQEEEQEKKKQKVSFAGGDDVYQHTSNATVTIIATFPNTSQSHGSGFVIGHTNQSVIIGTCAHVLLQGEDTEIKGDLAGFL